MIVVNREIEHDHFILIFWQEFELSLFLTTIYRCAVCRSLLNILYTSSVISLKFLFINGAIFLVHLCPIYYLKTAHTAARFALQITAMTMPKIGIAALDLSHINIVLILTTRPPGNCRGDLWTTARAYCLSYNIFPSPRFFYFEAVWLSQDGHMDNEHTDTITSFLKTSLGNY